MGRSTVGYLKKLLCVLTTVCLISGVALFYPELNLEQTALADSYNAAAAVAYARQWAYSRNSAYHDYSNEGGDCANFVSQCLKEGGLATDSSWKAGSYSWINAIGLYTWLTGTKGYYGSKSQPSLSSLKAGDVIWMTGASGYMGHVMIISEVTSSGIKACGHTNDRKDYGIPLSNIQAYVNMNGSTSELHLYCRYLQKGMSGNDVKELQQYLIDLGYSVGADGADGIFGANTESAVKAFQSANGLTVDGVFGQASYNKLLELINGYYLDVNGWLDGVESSTTEGYGTFDIYVNGACRGSGVSDYYHSWPKGSTYEIKNIKGVNGCVYNGVYSGSLSGTVGTEYVSIFLKFDHVYSVSYDANTTDAVIGMPAAQTKTHGEALTLSNGTPTRAGYVFQGWATSAGGGVVYAPGASYTNNAAATLYAVWKKSVKGVFLDQAAVTVVKGSVLLLNATVVPSDAANPALTWSTSDASVATVNSSGLVTAKGNGTAIITVTTVDGGYQATCAITVAPSLVLPAGLIEIGEESFAGIDAVVVILPQKCEEIGARAFADCTNLKEIYIPASVLTISRTAFAGCPADLVIHGKSGSVAQAFATARGYTFVEEP